MSKATKLPNAPEIISKKAAAQKIMAVASEIHEDIVKKHRKPEMVFPIRSLQNVKYDVKRGHFEILGKTATRTLSYNTVKTFAQSMRLLATTKNDLLDKDDIAGKREVYYNSKSWGECRFDEQPESDTLLDDIEAMLAINREQLGYIPEERGGDVTGPLVVIDQDPGNGKDIRIDCAKVLTVLYDSVRVDILFRISKCPRFTSYFTFASERIGNRIEGFLCFFTMSA